MHNFNETNADIKPGCYFYTSCTMWEYRICTILDDSMSDLQGRGRQMPSNIKSSKRQRSSEQYCISTQWLWLVVGKSNNWRTR